MRSKRLQWPRSRLPTNRHKTHLLAPNNALAGLPVPKIAELLNSSFTQFSTKTDMARWNPFSRKAKTNEPKETESKVGQESDASVESVDTQGAESVSSPTPSAPVAPAVFFHPARRTRTAKEEERHFWVSEKRRGKNAQGSQHRYSRSVQR